VGDFLFQRSIQAMRSSEIGFPPEHNGLDDLLFGVESTISKEQFLNTIIEKNCNWILDSSKIRQRVVPFYDENILQECDL